MFQNVRNHCHDSQTNTTTDTVLVFFSEGISAVTSTITSQFCSSADLNLLHSVLNTWLFSNEYRALSLEVHFAKAYSTEGISVAGGGQHGLVQLWDLPVGQRLQRLLQAVVVPLQLPLVLLLVRPN